MKLLVNYAFLAVAAAASIYSVDAAGDGTLGRNLRKTGSTGDNEQVALSDIAFDSARQLTVGSDFLIVQEEGGGGNPEELRALNEHESCIQKCTKHGWKVDTSKASLRTVTHLAP